MGTFDEVAEYAHSPVHAVILRQDYVSLRRIVAELPCTSTATEISTEADSILAEHKADAVSAIIDRRDVRGRETPLHVAVRLGDVTAVEILMAAGADWSLQNAQGWNALQEAVCAKQEKIATIITQHYRPLAWAKWCRRLPRLTATMRRMRDFYMELTFHFESSVVPFVGKIAPSDTYKIWKQGANLRADMTLAGFDGLKIQRSDQSYLFFGNAGDDKKLRSGMLCVLSHKEKEVMDALEGGGLPASETEASREVSNMSKTSMYRPGIDITKAVLVPQCSWRGPEKTQTVGSWKAKLYDMHHVTVSLRSRRVTGAITEEHLSLNKLDDLEYEDENFDNILTEDEKRQMEAVPLMEEIKLDDTKEIKMDEWSGEEGNYMDDSSLNVGACLDGHPDPKQSKRGWFDLRNAPDEDVRLERNADAIQGNLKIKSNSKNSSKASVDRKGWNSKTDEAARAMKTAEKAVKSSNMETSNKHEPPNKNNNTENEFKKGLRPTLWLTPDFPLKIDELLPLLDILANKVKAVRRLRDLLKMKLPSGTFPVKIAIPVVPTIRMIVTFTKFEDLCAREVSPTPVLSPMHLEERRTNHDFSSGSLFSWIRVSQNQSASTSTIGPNNKHSDPFSIPSDYVWVTIAEKKQRQKEKKNKNETGKKTTTIK